MPSPRGPHWWQRSLTEMARCVELSMDSDPSCVCHFNNVVLVGKLLRFGFHFWSISRGRWIRLLQVMMSEAAAGGEAQGWCRSYQISIRRRHLHTPPHLLLLCQLLTDVKLVATCCAWPSYCRCEICLYLLLLSQLLRLCITVFVCCFCARCYRWQGLFLLNFDYLCARSKHSVVCSDFSCDF